MSCMDRSIAGPGLPRKGHSGRERQAQLQAKPGAGEGMAESLEVS